MRDGYCEHHKQLSPEGYIQRHDWATKRISQNLHQVKCQVCKRYLFPDELNEPKNTKSRLSIERHKAYLEKHPKALSVFFDPSEQENSQRENDINNNYI